ncbi:alpha/beta fold hydrolase [Pseudovibrio sp. FO-BEG1]|uniref:alpha/beta fold hydrolase n=1 Tax=Pseudovibrio sp. (strain FO-BEG1) TaxID=911045 RepID=UPI00030370C7|nr:alpha/beta hydrolase [Pseudovibrio sp. FO-BEG1]
MLLVDTDFNRVPEGTESGFVQTEDNVKIRWARWAPTGSPLKGTVTIVQGRTEFIEKYFEVVEELRARGFYVVAFDLRGQGGSERLLKNERRGHVESFDEFALDLHAVLDNVSLSDCPGPHFLLGHSTGGAVVMHANRRLKTKIDRAVLTAPLVGLAMSGRIRKFAGALAKSLVWVGMGNAFVPGGNDKILVDYDGNTLTSDPDRFKRMNDILEAAPQLGLGSPTVSWFRAMGMATERFKEPEFQIEFGVPSLVIGAGRDEIVSTDDAEELCRSCPGMSFLEIRGSRHEILMERDPYREQFWAAFDAFIPGSAD